MRKPVLIHDLAELLGLKPPPVRRMPSFGCQLPGQPLAHQPHDHRCEDHPQDNDDRAGSAADRTIAGERLLCPTAALPHDFSRYEPYRESDPERYEQKVIEVAENRDEVRNQTWSFSNST